MPDFSVPVIRVKPREDRRIRGGHPWLYANELELSAATKSLVPGSMVRVQDAQGQPIGVGSFNLHSLIAFRLFDTDITARIDAAFLGRRLLAAQSLRARFFAAPFYRLIHAEGDGLPGFVIDRFGDSFVVQANTAGAELLTPILVKALVDELGARHVVLRNDSPVRRLEGLEEAVITAWGAADAGLAVTEGGVTFALDALEGQKTGWYYDLRFARDLLAGLGRDASVLDCYCHTGAFALRLAQGDGSGLGARSVLGIDRSELALKLASRTAAAHGLDGVCRFEKAEAFEALSQLAMEGKSFDIVVTDPPNFVKSRKDLGPGARAYRKLARLAAPLVAPGGLWFVACCAHLLPADVFAKETAAGLAAAGRGGRILAQGGAGPDHPVHPHLPESAYLKWQLYQLD